ncbi:MAG: phytanoyl-CoA dioxygenase [Deltaproteobacteria bacterium]|jgi:hypothetical protein|nr:phytanoyl-CoA dioxygenase [Deltaproteobacteria bacterium]
MANERRYNAGICYETPRSFPEYVDEKNLRVLSWDEWQCWQKNGYLAIPGLVPKRQCEDLIEVICKFLGVKREQPESWYAMSPRSEKNLTLKTLHGMTELYHHQAMWNNRQFPRLYDAFVDLWGTEELWVTIDRVNMNLPNREGWQNDGFLHWDIDLAKRDHVRNIQGVLSLNDNDTDMGGLQIVPDLFKQLDNWLECQPKNRSRLIKKDELDFDVINLESKAGDLVIWDSRMAHGTSPNHSNKPRYAQYISMCPAEPEEEELLQIRLESFERRIGPRECGMPGSNQEACFGPKAKLTELGQRLLGSVSW